MNLNAGLETVMAFPDSIYEIPLTVRFSETDAFGLLKPVSVFNYFQDAASAHTHEMRVSAPLLLPEGKSWVVVRYRLEIDRYPIWNESLTLRTWRCQDRRLYELRCFEITDASGTRIISGKSCWVLISVQTRKPLRLDRNLPERMKTGGPAIENDLEKLPDWGQTDWKQSVDVRNIELDFNNHVNNAVYIGWIWEQMPEIYHSEYRIRSLDIQFVGDALKDDRVLVENRSDKSGPHAFYHRVTRAEGGHEVTRAHTVWQPLDKISGGW